jgi:hypothetical protein
MTDDPFNDYLWDRRGDPDGDVRHFEVLLERYRFNKPIRMPAAQPGRRRWLWYAATAATAAAAVVAFAAYVALIPVLGQPGAVWAVVARAGQPTVSGVAILGSGTLAEGGVVQTDASSRAEIRAGRIGRIEVEPGSRVRLLSTSTGRHRLAVDRGRIVARLWSPPFTFGFVTPAADAFDVGCAFTMDVDGRGAATVRVTSGWVQLETLDRQQLIPEGALAVAEPGKGLGTPFFDDASTAFKKALHALDFEPMTAADRSDQLAMLLREARRQDVYTFLRLNRALSPQERGVAYDRIALLSTPPGGATRAGMVADDGAMLDAWRRTLGFPEVKRWWLHWTDAFGPLNRDQ